MKRLNTFIITFFLIISILPLSNISASQTSSSITSFSGGLASKTIELSGGQVNNSATIDIPRNVTFTSAGFDLDFDQTDSSPGQISVDIYEDGILEWNYSGQGYGNIGEQTTFYDGSNFFVQPTNAGNSSVPGVMLPSSGVLQSSTLDASFTPQAGGGFYEIGGITDIVESDIDSDGNPEPVILLNKNSNNTSKILWADWDINSGISLSQEIQTCDNATSVSVGDLNNDAQKDIVAFSTDSSTACIHLANNTAFDPVINITITDGLLLADLGNVNSFGGDELVSLNSSGWLNYHTWNNTTSNLNPPISQIIYPNGSIGMAANLRALHVDDFFGNGKISALVGDVMGHWTLWQHFNLSGGWGGPLTVFDDISQNEILADFDNDGDIDIIGTNDAGYAMRINNGSQWNLSSSQGQIDLLNATIVDYNNDGEMEILTPITGISDGNNQTINGNITIQTINATNVSTVSSTFLEPWSMPTSIIAMDMDSDGIPEQIIGAGESSLGLFIAGYHSIALDADGDGNLEMERSGYAGDSSNGLEPLTMIDQMDGIRDDLAPLIQIQPTIVDGYGISMVNYSMNAKSSGVGSFNYSNLEIRYDSSFHVDLNPYASANLTNVINQGMTAGIGTYNLSIPINSTLQGTISVTNLVANYVQGAPNLALPITPSIQLTGLTHQSVTIEWNDLFDFGPDILNFELFRLSEPGQTIDLANPFANTLLSNIYVDNNVSSGTTYTYVVRSVHEFGVTSNLSSPLQVTVPYPAPPALIEGLQLSDISPDTGGELQLLWNATTETIAEYEIYLETVTFVNISSLTPFKTVSASQSQTNLTGLTDGQPYWAAVVAVDSFGNRSNSVISVGPAYPRNDTPLVVDLSINVSEEISFQSPFELEVIGQIDGNNINLLGDLLVEMETNLGTFTIANTWEGITLDSFSELVENSSQIYGEVTFWANYSGHSGDEIERPKSISSTSSTVMVNVVADFYADKETLYVDDQNMTSVNISLQSLESTQQNLMETVEYEWVAFNTSSNQSISGNGLFSSSNQEIAFAFNGGGTIFINLTSPEWIDVSSSHLQLTINSFQSDTNENDSNSNSSTDVDWQPNEMSKLVIDCGQIIINPESDEMIVCNASNPNNFSVDFTLVPDGWSDWSEFIEFSPRQSQTTYSLIGLSSIDIEIQVNILQNLSANSLLFGNIELDWVQSPTNYDTLQNIPYTENIIWNLIEENEVIDTDSDNNNANQSTPVSKAKSSSDNLILIGGVGAVAVFALIVIIILRIRNSDVEDWDEDDLDMEPDLKSKETSRPLPVGVALDEFEDRTITDESPDRPDIISDFDTAQDNEVTERVEEEIYEDTYEEEDYDSEISTDEHGTEWYEDEVGVWWFREEGQEDWSEFVE